MEGRIMERRHCDREAEPTREAIQGRHTRTLDRFVAALLAMTPVPPVDPGY
jgi:hypothetical protein